MEGGGEEEEEEAVISIRPARAGPIRSFFHPFFPSSERMERRRPASFLGREKATSSRIGHGSRIVLV